MGFNERDERAHDSKVIIIRKLKINEAEKRQDGKQLSELTL